MLIRMPQNPDRLKRLQDLNTMRDHYAAKYNKYKAYPETENKARVYYKMFIKLDHKFNTLLYTGIEAN